MNLDDYRTVFIAGSLVLMMIAASPTLDLILPFPSGGEKFSELLVLGPNNTAEDYPFNVRVNESYSIFAGGVGNRLGVSSYYLVYVKFRNQTQPLPNSTSSEPSPLTPLYESRAFVADGRSWEMPLALRILEISRYGDSVVVSRVSINGGVFAVNASAKWDSEFKGYFFQLFLELWLYAVTSRSFQFHNRFVGIWINITA